MNLCLNTDSVADLTLDEALDFAAGLGIGSVEIATGGQSTAPHMRLRSLLADARERASLTNALSSRGLRLAAINCSAWPMHPRLGRSHVELIRNSISLASELGVEKVVAMSGCPGDGPSARTINWIWFPWPADMLDVRDEQWELAISTWEDLAKHAARNGVGRIALELHPLHLVYNVPTLIRLRDAVGPVIGANIDPSHMFWQSMDPVRVIEALGDAVQHVHLKDAELCDGELALTGVLDARPLADAKNRAWIFRTVGKGHPAGFWSRFLAALDSVGYDDVLSIEGEDPLLPGPSGVEEAVEFLSSLVGDEEQGSRITITSPEPNA